MYIYKVSYRLFQSQHRTVEFFVAAGTGKIIKGFIGDMNNMVLYKHRALGCPVDRVLDGAFPLHHGPALVVVSRELAENGFKIYLPVAQRAKPAGALQPVAVAPIHTLPAGGIEFGILDMKHFYAFVVNVDILKIVEALQHKMRGVV